MKPSCYVEETLESIKIFPDCTLTDTFVFGQQGYRILFKRLFRKFNIRLGIRGPLVYRRTPEESQGNF